MFSPMTTAMLGPWWMVVHILLQPSSLSARGTPMAVKTVLAVYMNWITSNFMVGLGEVTFL